MSPHRPDRGHRDRAPRADREGFSSEFFKLDLPEDVKAGIHDAGFAEMTPVQRESMPQLLRGEDLIGQAQTGTGKTACFLLTIFTRALRDIRPREKDPIALILSPTRELAIQTYKEALTLGKYVDLRFGLFYGGEDYRKQEQHLAAGVDVAVGTPGRLLDFVRKGRLRLGDVRLLVIDEADRLLDLGFYEEMTAILKRLPPKDERQSMMFSATFDQRAQRLARQYMRAPSFIEIEPENLTAEGIDETLFHVDKERKFELLLGLLEREPVPRGLIFTNMKISAAYVAERLRRNGYSVELLTGDLPQNRRTRVLDSFRKGEVALLVASDVASRGLHVEDVSHVFNYDVPQDPEDYVHRIGRTARAGKTGKAYTLACDEYVYNLPAIEAYLKRRVPFVLPHEEEFGHDKTEGFGSLRDFARRERRRQREAGGDDRGGARRRPTGKYPERARTPRVPPGRPPKRPAPGVAVARSDAPSNPGPPGEAGEKKKRRRRGGRNRKGAPAATE
ncbi:DEAD/DEAH box helicase [bacterium]|nr:DEAD/DEAH box helicase [bacterium]